MDYDNDGKRVLLVSSEDFDIYNTNDGPLTAETSTYINNVKNNKGVNFKGTLLDFIMEEGGLSRIGSTTSIDILSTQKNKRKAMNHDEFDKKYGYHPGPKTTFIETVIKPYYRPFKSSKTFFNTLIGFVPICSILQNYNFKKNIMNDIIGGITVGVMHVPQGIAYATLAGVPTVYGLYTSLLPPFIYMIFGTSQHNSIGSFAVVALMAGSVVDIYTSDDLSPIKIATTLTFTIGLVQLIMGIFRLQFIATYFSDQVISGYTTAASFYVLISQIKDILGLRKMPRRGGIGGFLLQCSDIFSKNKETHLPTFYISIISMIFLIIGKDIISPIFKKNVTKIPIPFELILMIISTTLSNIFQFREKYNIKVVSDIPIGMPYFEMPCFSLIPSIIPQAIGIAVVIVAVHISLAKMFAKKLYYKVDPGQELYALGFSSIFSSFFNVYPCSCSLGRTVVNVEAGTKTNLSAIPSAVLVGSVVLYLGVIIIVALKGLLRKFNELKILYPLSKIDFCIWIVSFLATILTDVMIGLAISIIFALMTTVFRTQYPSYHILANCEDSYEYRDAQRYSNARFYNGICVYRFDSPLLFTNIDRFKTTIQKTIEEWEDSHHDTLTTEDLVIKISNKTVEKKICNALENPKKITTETSVPLRHFIIDCSGFTFVDYMGVNAIKEVHTELNQLNILTYFAATKASVRELFENSGFYKFVGKENFYPTVYDAVEIARQRQNDATLCILSKLEVDNDFWEGYLNVPSIY
ncbi:FI18412p1 [Strongyloides ratti]|uniref:FI18412p1 n=1 Tax=Strongyloides ratti TaxID=34506 RepID=A0A090MXF2_STRRB|nr:FI18412p1 [Strongyloides ratti]CEF65329.1 FI18412p1 [Strongyloides ratti]